MGGTATGGTPPEQAPLTPAQQRALTGADPDTGEVRAAAATRQRLERLGLARPHGRLGAHYLTGRGRAVRARLQQRDAPAAAPPEAPAGGFTPLTGDERESADRPAHAAAAVRSWEALLEIRRLSGAGQGPAPWERSRPVHAVALALEAAGIPASAVDGSGRRVRTGYRVGADGDAGGVRVDWRAAAGADGTHGTDGVNGWDGAGGADGPREQLAACARLLMSFGWDAERYLDARRRPYLRVAPCAARSDARS